ncbi:hypothetical protein HBH92_032520 [Parastagonospora nodorum]|nr:hypothetical protein HBH92_032520 [Parastagonospora nodorum]KAH4452980.1 hypothetical protein HBH93_030010 [Parastagonospora nodorum]KAH4465891.1 hypothetical protein HBH91_032540 [Parastagonospora nodorum]KAH4517285.1 hypothetical protein HBH89_009340 [Parastagonospora nodorum]KAH4553083.1 hypothetical protein HBH85_024940 [Parastagonospora nodorum]
MDLNFVPGVAFISNVYIADSLRVRTPINLSAILYEQAAARTSLPAEVSNMDLDFVPGVAFISNVYIADSLRARTLINLSAVLLRARTLINPSAVLYEQVSIMDLNFVPGVAFNAMGNVELTGDLLGDVDRVNNNNNNERTALLAKRIKTNEDCKKSTHPGNNRNNLNIMVTDPTGREFGRVDMKSLTGLCLLIDRAKLYCKQKWAHDISKFYKSKNIQLLRPFTQQELIPRELGSIYVLRSVDKIRANVADVFDTVVSKLDEVPTQEPSSHIKTELYLHQKLRDNGRKFYRLVITGEDTHCKQIIKKAYIISLERASLILFII